MKAEITERGIELIPETWAEVWAIQVIFPDGEGQPEMWHESMIVYTVPNKGEGAAKDAK